MTSDKRGASDVNSKLTPQHLHGGQADRHQRRLCVLGESEVFGRTLAHQAEQVLAENIVHLQEHGPSLGESVRQLGAHADSLAALPGEKKCEAHERAFPDAVESADAEG